MGPCVRTRPLSRDALYSGGVRDFLVWVDCEMTGLDLTTDALIEVAALVTRLALLDPPVSGRSA